MSRVSFVLLVQSSLRRPNKRNLIIGCIKFWINDPSHVNVSSISLRSNSTVAICWSYVPFSIEFAGGDRVDSGLYLKEWIALTDANGDSRLAILLVGAPSESPAPSTVCNVFILCSFQNLVWLRIELESSSSTPLTWVPGHAAKLPVHSSCSYFDYSNFSNTWPDAWPEE